MVSVNVGFL